MSKDVLEMIVGLGEKKSSLEREINGMSVVKEALTKEVTAFKDEKGKVLAKEEQDLKSRINSANKDFSARENDLSRKEKDIETRLRESELIAGEWDSLKKAQILFDDEKKDLQKSKAKVDEKARDTDLKVEQLEIALNDVGVDPKKLEKSIVDAVAKKKK